MLSVQDKKYLEKNFITREEHELFTQSVAAEFLHIHYRLGGIEGRLERVEKSFDRLENKVGILENKMDGLESKVDSLKGKVDLILEKIDQIPAVVYDHNQRLTKLETAKC